GNLGLRLEQVRLDACGLCRLRNVDQQRRHLGLAGQFAQHLAQHLVHLRELSLQGIQVHHLGLLVFELVPERDFLLLPGCKRVLLAADVEVPAKEQDHDDDDRDEEALDRRGPAANVVAIEIAQVIEEFHGLAPPLLVDATGAGFGAGAEVGAEPGSFAAGAEAGAACGDATGALTGAATVDAGLTAVLATAAAGAAVSDVAGMAALEPEAGPEPSLSPL